MPQGLPTVTGLDSVVDTLKLWQRQLSATTKQVKTPTIPWNFAAQGKAAGVQLTWAKADDATGYEVSWSETPDLSSPHVVRLDGADQLSYFDSIGSSGVTRWYKLRAVNVGDQGKIAFSPYTGIVNSTTQPAPTYTAPVVRDRFTNDRAQVAKGIYIR